MKRIYIEVSGVCAGLRQLLLFGMTACQEERRSHEEFYITDITACCRILELNTPLKTMQVIMYKCLYSNDHI